MRDTARKLLCADHLATVAESKEEYVAGSTGGVKSGLPITWTQCVPLERRMCYG